MTQFSTHTARTAPQASQPLLAQVQKALGFVPNLFAVLAESPQVLEGYLTLSAALDKGTLTAAERELVNIAVSTENTCHYCVAAHSTLAGLQKIRPEIVEAVRTGNQVPDPTLNALIALTRELVRQQGSVSDAAIAAFLAVGYTKAQLLEVIGRVGLKVIANFANNLAATPLDNAFEPQRWERRQLRVA